MEDLENKLKKLIIEKKKHFNQQFDKSKQRRKQERGEGRVTLGSLYDQLHILTALVEIRALVDFYSDYFNDEEIRKIKEDCDKNYRGIEEGVMSLFKIMYDHRYKPIPQKPS